MYDASILSRACFKFYPDISLFHVTALRSAECLRSIQTAHCISDLRSDEKVASLLVVMLKWMAESPEISLPWLQEIQDKENGKILV